MKFMKGMEGRNQAPPDSHIPTLQVFPSFPLELELAT